MACSARGCTILSACTSGSCILALFLLAGSVPILAQGSGNQKRLMSYYPMWAKSQVPPYAAPQIPYRKMTHILHAFLWLDPRGDGSLSIDPSLLEPPLIAAAHASGVKVMISISDRQALATFSTVARNATTRQTFARNVHDFVVVNGYDGVDIDWEVPKAPADTQPCTLLMQALRDVLPSPNFLLSMAIGADPRGTGFDVPALAPILDFINVMTYDIHGPWSSHSGHNSPLFLNKNDPGLEGSLETSMDLFEKTYAVPLQKLNIGTAFYGYDFEDVDSLWKFCNCSQTTSPANYGTYIKLRINGLGWKSYFDAVAKAPYLLYEGTEPRSGFITYDDPTSTQQKTAYVLGERNMGGVFMWELSADYDGQTQDLLDAMYRAFVLTQEPAFTAADVTNAASFASGISPGAIASIFGKYLSTVSGIVKAGAAPLPRELANTSVVINGIRAPLFAVANVNGQEQINFQVPFEVAEQTSASIVVNNGWSASQPLQVPLLMAEPGIFTFDGTNAAALHGANGSTITSSSPAVRGETIVIYATGLGPVSAGPGTGNAASRTTVSRTTNAVSVAVEGLNATVAFSGLAPDFVGLYQVNAVVPAGVRSGSLHLIMTVDGLASPPARIAVQ